MLAAICSKSAARFMDEWAQYCSAPFVGGKVLPLRRSSE